MSEPESDVFQVPTPDGHPDVFIPRTTEGTKAFLEREQEAWSSVLNGGGSNTVNNWLQLLNQLNQTAHGSLEQADSFVSSLAAILNESPVLIPDGEIRRHVLHVAEQQPEVASRIVELLGKRPWQANMIRSGDPAIIQAICHVEMLRENVLGRTSDFQGESVDTLWPDASAQLTEVHRDHFDRLKADHDDSHNVVSELRDLLSETRETSTRTIDEASTKLDSAIEAHRERLALAGAIDLWTQETVRRDIQVIDNERDFYLSVAVALALLIMVPAVVLNSAADWLAALEGSGSTLILGLLGAAAFTIIAIPRYCYRRVVSARHLSVDAWQRQAMIRTFISLTADEHASPDDRAALIAAIFRPISSGYVREEQGSDVIRDLVFRNDPASPR